MEFDAALAAIAQLDEKREDYKRRLNILQRPELERGLDGYVTEAAMPAQTAAEWNEWLKGQVQAMRSVVAQLRALA
jgi:hypothetical protein